MPEAFLSPPAASPEGATPETATGLSDLSGQLTALLADAAVNSDAAPCLIARNLDSPVVQAMLAALPALRARNLSPLLLLAEAPRLERNLKGVHILTLTPDVASLLHEQVIAGDWVWCGASAARRSNSQSNEGRLFNTLTPVELRSFAIVFQGLWASGAPLPAIRLEQSATPLFNWRNAFASGMR